MRPNELRRTRNRAQDVGGAEVVRDADAPVGLQREHQIVLAPCSTRINDRRRIESNAIAIQGKHDETHKVDGEGCTRANEEPSPPSMATEPNRNCSAASELHSTPKHIWRDEGQHKTQPGIRRPREGRRGGIRTLLTRGTPRGTRTSHAEERPREGSTAAPAASLQARQTITAQAN